MKTARPQIRIIKLTAIAILLSLGLQLGCSSDIATTGSNQTTDMTTAVALQNEIASPGETPQAAPISNILNGTTSLVTRLILSPCGVDSGRISAQSGGSFYLHCGGEVTGRFTVPAGAIRKDTTIIARTSGLSIAGLAIREYDFSPDGLVFRSPATLEFHISELRDGNGFIPTSLLWLYFNPLTQRWELERLLKPDSKGMIRVQVEHFSKYRATSNNVGLSQGGQK